ncbi:MAG: hypothetical protein K8I00_05230, partial [Candidatus Omnitrophica bacterium]|nr:hypothetical protein [Candidatus Omnitrophota bacterium]
LARQSISHVIYARYNLYHMWRFVCERYGIPVRGATRILNAKGPDDMSRTLPPKESLELSP